MLFIIINHIQSNEIDLKFNLYVMMRGIKKKPSFEIIRQLTMLGLLFKTIITKDQNFIHTEF